MLLETSVFSLQQIKKKKECKKEKKFQSFSLNLVRLKMSTLSV